ncbi:peptide ABC transporter permease [Actinoplanes philippinensis]|uniref:EamA-like transporter family protein n=1 Tax=Actinoplanes philippinensis TaxID=35752 RepID=A0A1I2EES4_9ACTN|nr:EamA family transporter [Actinoplanes philippinensis]GIE77069.1 peptide ABC transporter permease [Actinoplanes philippinensis]SFE90981.1 EamA-like transporter family protein [Actinoplanes philippinensis]
MVPVGALALVLASAFVHALWNVLFARASRGVAALAVTNVAGLAVWAPVALARWRIEAGAWPYLLVSAAFQIYYLVVLRRAYLRAPAHTVYPVARGLGPVLVLVATTAGGAPVPWVAYPAVALISAGVWLSATGSVDRRVLAAAFPVAISAAAYPFVAGYGLRHADPAAYLWLSTAPLTVGTLAIALVTDRPGLRAALRPATIATGAGMVASGGLLMTALSMVEPGQVPAIAALRETGTLFVIPLSWLIDRTFTRAAAAGAVLVFAGAALLALR